ncbi:MAG TPA: tRNA lysidine(34) synthetase TilS [Puia sp.]|jgi:tRNA(Ile)-lysidine synthase
MELLTSFDHFIKKENLFSPGDKLLLAVSGGVDSVVLCELCHQAGLDFTIAHCNFQLRGTESDRDEQFVRQLVARYNREILVRRFDTEQYAAEKKLSIQVAARELRYAWFHEIINGIAGQGPNQNRRPGQPPYHIVTAHHLDDNIETLLMNFFKGTGIAGLRAMLPRQGAVIRPLLFAEKTQLQQFAELHRLSWVEDSSNLTDKYTRNYFRHQLIPLVRQQYPGAIQNLGANIDRFREIETIYRQAIGLQKHKLYEYEAGDIYIPVLKLKKSEPLYTIVYEVIADFGFSPNQTGAAIDLLDSPSGKYIRSSTHRILKDRNWLIVTPHEAKESLNVLVEAPAGKVFYDRSVLRIESLPISKAPAHLLAEPSTGPAPAHQPAANGSIAWLDAAHIQFPLLLRKWQHGDYFYPLGMRKKKKLARFFIDNKLSLADKEKIWVLEMDKKIIWVVGMRIDDRYRITPQTREVLKIESGMA